MGIVQFKTRFICYCFLASVLLIPSMAFADGILGGSIFVQETGNVSVAFEGRSSQFTHTIYLEGFGELFSSNVASGTTLDLGSYEAGQELTFSILVQQNGKTFYTGMGELNGDGVAHAYVENIEMGTRVSFEDLQRGGDRDYDDVRFLVSNTGTEYVDPDGNVITQPEPATFILFSSGLVGLAIWRHRKIEVNKNFI